jgi:hypothetical protein
MAAPLTRSMPPFLRMALNDSYPRRRVPPIFPSADVGTEAANPAAKSATSPGSKESNALPLVFPLTAIVDHPRRGFSSWPLRFRRTF